MQTLKSYSIHLKSITPLIMHKDTLADPLHPLKKEMKILTSIKDKKDEHHLAMAKIEWTAGLYYDDEIGLYLSSKMIMGCLRASARKEKKGLLMKAVFIDCLPGAVLMPYEGISVEKLWATINKKGEQIYTFVESVNIDRKKTMRTRPIFRNWEVKFNIQLNIELLAEADFKRILERAGFEFGVGECRPQLATGTYGRFKLEEMKET